MVFAAFSRPAGSPLASRPAGVAQVSGGSGTAYAATTASSSSSPFTYPDGSTQGETWVLHEAPARFGCRQQHPPGSSHAPNAGAPFTASSRPTSPARNPPTSLASPGSKPITTPSTSVAPGGTKAGGGGSCPDAQAALDAHNAARARRGAPPLSWSASLAQYAQGVSSRCVLQVGPGRGGQASERVMSVLEPAGFPPPPWSQMPRNLPRSSATHPHESNVRFRAILQHSGGPYGENLALGVSSCASAVQMWLAEERSYVPGSDYSPATGHFTQARVVMGELKCRSRGRPQTGLDSCLPGVHTC